VGNVVEFPAPRPRLTPLQERLILEHVYLARRIARHIGARVPPCFDIDDLEGPGFLALVEAALRFRDEPDGKRTRSERFVAYARRWIEGAIKESIRRGKWREATQIHVEDLTDPHEQFADVRQRPDEEMLAKEVAEQVRSQVRAWLPDRERAVVEMHYGGGAKLADAGERIGVSPSRAAQLHRKALRRLEPRLRLVA
jgi:RNA polymerase sigma factor (sigma-70 family)